jgi:hypothetical protein
MPLTKLSLAGNNLIIPARESLVSDLPARDGKIATLFYSVGNHKHVLLAVAEANYQKLLYKCILPQDKRRDCG